MTTIVDTGVTLKDFVPIISVMVGGVLAIGGGFASNLLIELRKNNNESKQLAYAFKGELQALSSIAKKRGYVKYIKEIISLMEIKNEPIFVHIHVRREYFNVFNSNVSKIGSLKHPLPEMIATFYVQANSVLEDLQNYREGVWANASVESLIGSKKELVSLMEDTFSLADEIAEKIENIYS